MKNKIIKILTLSVILLLSVCFMVACNQGNNSDEGTGDSNVQQNATADKYFTFTLLDDGTYSIKSKDIADMPANVVIPASYKRKAVTTIGDSAFRECQSLVSIEIPDSVTNIGDSAFRDCQSLVSVEIPDGVTNIGDSAFSGCKNLTSVVIPNGITNIANYTFNTCPSLVSIEIPDGVTAIGDYAFFNCYKLTNVVIPDSVTTIGAKVFGHCSNLTSVEIPDGVTSIGFFAFESCNKLQYNVKENLKYLGNEENPYLYLVGVTSKGITSASIDQNCRFVGDYAFSECVSLISVVIPDGVEVIGCSAFYCCRSMTSVVIPNSAIFIGDMAFYGCSSLTSIKYHGTQTKWGEMNKGYEWDYNTGNYTITYNYAGE